MHVSKTGDPHTLGLKVTNFGPIVEADIELRPLTVFVGPSNTGKSYLAILIYALHLLFAEHLNPQFRLFRRFRDHDRSRAPAKRDTPVELTDRLLKWLDEIPEEPDRASPGGVPPLPPDIADLVREAMRTRDDLGSALRTRIARCFGVGPDVGQLVRAGSRGGSRITIGSRASSGSAAPTVGHEFSMGRGQSKSSELRTSVPSGAGLHLPTGARTLAIASMFRTLQRLESTEEGEDETLTRVRWANNALAALVELAMANSVGPLSHSAYYLPADRTGVMHAHRTVIGAAIDRASSAGIVDAPNVPTLSGVTGDFLQELIQIGDERHPTVNDGDVLASALEQDVLRGGVAVERSEANYPTFVYRPTGLDRDFPIMTSSSMVSELAPVVLYLRHHVTRGNTLIIEEPESHLHPAMQAEFALHLVRLVHAGIRVIVTTHSEWILDQFANLVRLSELSEEERKGLRGADAALSADDVGIWLFKHNAKRRGSVVQELKVDPEAGGLLSGYDEVAEQLHNEWAEIGNRIADRGAV